MAVRSFINPALSGRSVFGLLTFVEVTTLQRTRDHLNGSLQKNIVAVYFDMVQY